MTVAQKGEIVKNSKGDSGCPQSVLKVVMVAFHGYGNAMTFTVRLLKLPERAVREQDTYPDINAALKADDYSLVVGGAFEVEITNDETGEVVHSRQIANKVPDIL